jgi:sugar phosphate isomerase/epimerase
MAMTHVGPGWNFVGASFEDRCTAGAAGGFAAIGVVPSVYDEARAAGHTDDDLRAMLQDAGVVVAEIEGLTIRGPNELGAQVEGPEDAGSNAVEFEHALEIADVFNVERMFFTAAPGVSLEQMAETFGWVCDRCGEHGLLAGLEFMNIPSISGLLNATDALQVVRTAGRRNGGMLVDVYHQVNGSNDWNELESLSGDDVVGIQFDDTAIPRVVDDYLEDTLHHRRAPGEGDADLVRFVRTMDAIGARCPYSMEVISDEIVKLPPTELGVRLGNSARRVLEAARS